MDAFFTVPGNPQGKGRPRFTKVGEYTKAFTPKQTVVYENLVKVSYLQECKGIKFKGPIYAHILAYFQIPKSVSKKAREIMEEGYVPFIHKIDADNLAKSILDALNGIAYDDDRQVAVLTVVKQYGENPRVEVLLEEMKINEGTYPVDMIYD